MQTTKTGKLTDPVIYLKGVGPIKGDLLLKEKGIKSQWDLIMDFPFRYIDRRNFTSVRNLNEEGQLVQLKGQIEQVNLMGTGRKKRLAATFSDGTGILSLVWFQGASKMRELIKPGIDLIIFGRISYFNKRKTMAHPELEIINKGTVSKFQSQGLQPVYSSTEKLSKRGLDTRGLRRIQKTLSRQITEKDIPENLPHYLLDNLKLPSRYIAFQWVHFPEDHSQLEAAIKRLAFEELFSLQLRMLFKMKRRKTRFKGLVFEKVGKLFNQFYNHVLPFELTKAQKRVVKEIRTDTKKGVQMNRLVQGDVGSGKTIVAVMAILLAIDNGYQACMMAPTEILATQHYTKISEQLGSLGLKVGFLSGNIKGQKRKDILNSLQKGDIHILIGTHAIIEDWVQFDNLGLGITDEQHRFGVKQRAKLWAKGKKFPPHIMVMTATPIPRTLAMTLYGDLDISVIDELPPGRKAIKTTQTRDKYRGRINNFLKNQIGLGRQIYVVYPLIEESSKLDLANLQQGYESLLEQFPRPQYQIGVVHGKMKPSEKDIEMQKFVEGRTNILVSTTVIEVGVNVPNASVMVIENAERFGLSQLHQLRGRVGRGAEQSHCILMTAYRISDVAKKRMEIMCRTNDGFEIAEEDLKIRGPGEIEGIRQSGDLNLKIANLAKDSQLLQTARKIAMSILEKDPDLIHPDNKLLRKLLENAEGSKILGKIG